MWGVRFASGPSEIMEEINASIEFDKRLFAHDIAGSIVHCEMLAATNIISDEDANKIAMDKARYVDSLTDIQPFKVMYELCQVMIKRSQNNGKEDHFIF